MYTPTGSIGTGVMEEQQVVLAKQQALEQKKREDLAIQDALMRKFGIGQKNPTAPAGPMYPTTPVVPVEEPAPTGAEPMQDSSVSLSSYSSTPGLYEKPVALSTQPLGDKETVLRKMQEAEGARETATQLITSPTGGLAGRTQQYQEAYDKQMARDEGVARAQVDWQLKAQKVREETEAKVQRADELSKYAKLPGGNAELADLQYYAKHGTPEEKERANKRLQWASSIDGTEILGSTKNKVIAIIANVLGAVGSALTKQPNRVPEIINGLIDQEAARQKSLFDSARGESQAIRTRYGIIRNELQDDAAALSMMKSHVADAIANLARKYGDDKTALLAESQAMQFKANAADKEASTIFSSMETADRLKLAKIGVFQQGQAIGLRAQQQDSGQMAPPGMYRFPGYENVTLKPKATEIAQKKQIGHLLVLDAYDELGNWVESQGGARALSKLTYGTEGYNAAKQQFGRLLSALKEKRNYGAALTEGEKELLAAEAGGSPLQYGAYAANLAKAKQKAVEEYGNEMATNYFWTDELDRRGYTHEMWRKRSKEKDRSSTPAFVEDNAPPPAKK